MWCPYGSNTQNCFMSSYIFVCIQTPRVSCAAGAGMVVDWEQETGLLMTSGDVRVIRIWDTDREMKVQVLYSCTWLQVFNRALFSAAKMT